MNNTVKTILGVVGGIVGVVVVLAIIDPGTGSGSSSATKPEEEDTREGAIDMCQQHVAQKLKAPSSAQWPTEGLTAEKNGKEWTVSGLVDSQNTFGAMIRARWRCEAEWQSGKTWKVGSQLIE